MLRNTGGGRADFGHLCTRVPCRRTCCHEAHKQTAVSMTGPPVFTESLVAIPHPVTRTRSATLDLPWPGQKVGIWSGSGRKGDHGLASRLRQLFPSLPNCFRFDGSFDPFFVGGTRVTGPIKDVSLKPKGYLRPLRRVKCQEASRVGLFMLFGVDEHGRKQTLNSKGHRSMDVNQTVGAGSLGIPSKQLSRPLRKAACWPCSCSG